MEHEDDCVYLFQKPFQEIAQGALRHTGVAFQYQGLSQSAIAALDF